MLKMFFSVVVLVLLSGCGSGDTKTYDTYEAVPEDINSAGAALIVSGNEGNTGISYTEVGENGLLIDCGEGGCGDIYVGSEVTDSGSDGSDAGCSGGNCGG